MLRPTTIAILLAALVMCGCGELAVTPIDASSGETVASPDHSTPALADPDEVEVPFTEVVIADVPDGPIVPFSGHHGPQIVYVNFDGPVIDDCNCSDATTNRSLVIGRIFDRTRLDFAPYNNSSGRASILRDLRTYFGGYNIEFVTSRPASGPFTMLVISTTQGPHHGVAPQDCDNRNPNDIAFVYSIADNSADTIARFAAHELGHSFGLAHARHDGDIMQWASTGRTFRASPIDTRSQHYVGQCFEGSTQDGPAMLHAALGPIFPESWNGTFVDDDDSIFEDAIEKIAAEGITSGCRQDPPSYCPDDTVTRGQMAAFLTRALDLPASNRDWFSDDDGSIFENAINRVAEAGITVGCGTDRYCPDSPVTRGQMAVFLDRALGLPGTSDDYFTDDEGRFYENSANKMYEAGITVGCGTSRYCGDDPVTRGQMAAFLTRALGL